MKFVALFIVVVFIQQSVLTEATARNETTNEKFSLLSRYKDEEAPLLICPQAISQYQAALNKAKTAFKDKSTKLSASFFSILKNYITYLQILLPKNFYPLLHVMLMFYDETTINYIFSDGNIISQSLLIPISEPFLSAVLLWQEYSIRMVELWGEEEQTAFTKLKYLRKTSTQQVNYDIEEIIYDTYYPGLKKLLKEELFIKLKKLIRTGSSAAKVLILKIREMLFQEIDKLEIGKETIDRALEEVIDELFEARKIEVPKFTKIVVTILDNFIKDVKKTIVKDLVKDLKKLAKKWCDS